MTSRSNGTGNFPGVVKSTAKLADDGPSVPVQLVICSGCKKSLTVANSHGSGPLPPEGLRRIAERKGWQFDKKGNHQCDDCLAPAAPRIMGQADGRRIFVAIDGCYDAKAGRYVGGYTDQKLGDELKVPWAWVASVREQFFGEHGGNDDADKLRVEIEALRAEVRTAIDARMAEAAKIEALLPKLAAIEKKLDAMEKAA